MAAIPGISPRIVSLVEEVLEKHPATRKNDMRLLTKIWEKQGFILPRHFITEAANAFKVIECREELQKRGLYSPVDPLK